jgi:hypothetical protein
VIEETPKIVNLFKKVDQAGALLGLNDFSTLNLTKHFQILISFNNQLRKLIEKK